MTATARIGNTYAGTPVVSGQRAVPIAFPTGARTG